MAEFLGLDTSNYTTSAAVFDSESMSITQKKLPLPVKDGERGLRQSDALFHHVRQLPETVSMLISGRSFSAVGVSVRPRNIPGSYMPCFLAGETAGELISSSLGIPLYKTSHQVGHILAALYSAGKLSLIDGDKPFIAFHLSGGTTDCLLCRPDSDEVIRCEEIARSLDLKAGQAVDRVGVMLGLKFPCGPELEKLALKSDRIYKIHPPMKDGSCSLSGIENICAKMHSDGEKPCDIALYCIKYIESALIKMTEYAIEKYGGLPLVYAGGVMSNTIIKNSVLSRFEADFAEPAFSSDNSAGVAVYAWIKEKNKCRS